MDQRASQLIALEAHNDRHRARLLGRLSKLSPASLKGWQKRYFVAQGRKLKYWKSSKEYGRRRHPKGIIDFDRVHCNLEADPKTFQFDLHLLGCKRVFSLKARNQTDFENWTRTLAEIIENSLGKQLGLEIRDKDFAIDFWRFDLIDEHSFLRTAETGDLLLMRGKHLGGKLQRQWTKGHADHAAMIVKLKVSRERRVYILESVM